MIVLLSIIGFILAHTVNYWVGIIFTIVSIGIYSATSSDDVGQTSSSNSYNPNYDPNYNRRKQQGNQSSDGNYEYGTYNAASAYENEIKRAYNVLGVAPSCSNEQIKKSYRTLVMKYHPDINHSSSSPERFREVQEAYEIIKTKRGIN